MSDEYYVDLSQVEESQGYAVIPDGAYPCTVDFAEAKPSRTGKPAIALWLKIESGKYAGRIIFDRLFFTPEGQKRLKFVVSRLGMDKDFKGSFKPEMFMGRRALVTTEVTEYNGKSQNKVPWDGYESLSVAPKNTPDDDDDIPF